MAHLQNQNIAFSELDRLADYLSAASNNPPNLGADLPTGTVDPKKYPIVLVPGFMGWSSPLFGYNYFGGLVNLAEVLAKQGWGVICPQVGPVSSNWERACELYAQLARGSMDGTTYDIDIDYGVAPPGTDVFYSHPRPSWRQAACFNVPHTWRWGPSSPVHFIAHSQGGNTCRYLIHLLERGWSSEGSSYFTEPKLGWVKSLTTLATPHNGSSIIPVLDELTDLEDMLLEKVICAMSFLRQEKRPYDFCLDHRGLGPPPPPKGGEEEVDFLTYVAQVSAPDGALTRWRQSTYNGFHDNSIIGVVGDLNKIIGSPSKDVYYFTLSFTATKEVPGVGLDMGDMLALPEEVVRTVGGVLDKLGFGGVLEKVVGLAGAEGVPAPVQLPVPWGAATVTSTVVVESEARISTPVSTAQSLLDRILGSGTNRFPRSSLNTSPPMISKPSPTWASSAIPSPLAPIPTGTGTDRSLASAYTAAPNSTQASTLIPRIDLNPLFHPVAYPMCKYVLTPTEKDLISAAGGPISDALWRAHDGVVPTVSMSGPFGAGNVVVSVEEIVSGGHAGMEEGGRGLKGVWVDLGKCASWDHADCIGTCLTLDKMNEVVRLYGRIGRLLSVLPVDRSGGERE